MYALVALPALLAAAPLDGFPTKPGPHAERIAALKPGEWLGLGAPAADPAHGRARGRSWSARMAYAPDLRAAFLFGEGVHSWWDKDTGRYMDDLWAYDLHGHRWVCAHPGSPVRDLTLKLDANGYEVDAAGRPVPVAQMVHGYEMVAYDTDRRKFLFMPCPGEYWKAALGERRAKWFPDGKVRSRPVNCTPWQYDVRSGAWELEPAAGPFPGSGYGDVLVYVPSLKKVWFRRTSGVWYFDPAAKAWAKAEAKGPPPPFGIDPVACLDTARRRVYVGGGGYPVAKGPHAFWAYDLASDTWIDPKPAGVPCGGDHSFGTQYAVMNYDAANDVVVLFRHKREKPEANGVYVYDPKANAWTTTPAPFPKEMPTRKEAWSGFYSPELNAHVLHLAGDSAADGTIWVYRHGRGKP